MRLLDNEGRIFGLVNIVDALVVLTLFIVVVGALFVVVVPDEKPEQPKETRYVTVDVGTQPSYISSLISEGDLIVGTGESRANITDTHISGRNDHTVLRVKIDSKPTDGVFRYDGTPLRVGQEITLDTTEYSLTGTVISVDTTDRNLSTAQVDTLIETTISTERASKIHVGDEYRTGDRTIGTIRSVETYPIGPDELRVHIGISYLTYSSGQRFVFGNASVNEGARLPFENPRYSFTGTVRRIGATEPRGQGVSRTVTVVIEEADESLASRLRTGLTERVRGRQTARVTNVSTTPSTVVLTSQSGNIYQRDHPQRKQIRMDIEISARQTDSELLVKGRPINYGDTIFFDFGSLHIDAKIIKIDG